MGRTALYRDPIPFRTARTDIQVDADALVLHGPDGRLHRHALDGVTSYTIDGFATARHDVRTETRIERRFVRMLVLEQAASRSVVITPPEHGALAPSVVRVPEAPADAAIVDTTTWDTLADWLLGGGRLAACAIADLARLAAIATSQFAALIGEVAAERALELAWSARAPLRGDHDVDSALQPLVDAARRSPRAGEALMSALAHAAGATRRRRRR